MLWNKKSRVDSEFRVQGMHIELQITIAWYLAWFFWNMWNRVINCFEDYNYMAPRNYHIGSDNQKRYILFVNCKKAMMLNSFFINSLHVFFLINLFSNILGNHVIYVMQDIKIKNWSLCLILIRCTDQKLLMREMHRVWDEMFIKIDSVRCN